MYTITDSLASEMSQPLVQRLDFYFINFEHDDSQSSSNYVLIVWSCEKKHSNLLYWRLVLQLVRSEKWKLRTHTFTWPRRSVKCFRSEGAPVAVVIT